MLQSEVQIEVKYLKPLTKLKYNCFDESGTLIQPAHKAFTQERINELLLAGIESLYYNPMDNTNCSKRKSLEDYLETAEYKGPRTISIETQKKGYKAITEIVRMIQNKEILNFVNSIDFINCVLNDIKKSKEEFVNLLALKIYDDHTYAHSINVGILSMVLAKELGKSEEEIIEIGLGGFLHDIGKIMLPFDILNKESNLSDKEYEKVKKHSLMGYDLLKDNKELTQRTKDIVLLHHEKLDGTGYPFHYKEKAIREDINIVTVAEVYDVLTSNLPYQNALTLTHCKKRIIEGIGSHFTENIALTFIDIIDKLIREDFFCSKDDYVLLNQNEIAKVFITNNNFPLKPIVEVYIQEMKIIEEPFFVDLYEDNEREIVFVFDKEQAFKLEEKIVRG